MRNSYLILIIGLISILIIAGCQTSTLKATPITNQPTEDTKVVDVPVEDKGIDQACMDVTCSSNQVCKEGSCVCNSNQKLCGDTCINKDSCCSDDDCTNGEFCKEGSCTFDCKRLSCREGMTCDANKHRCVCPKDYKFCERQEKCIPTDHCCSRFDCRNNERCTDTITSAEICIEDDGLACKIFNTVGKKTLTVSGGTYDINLSKITFLDFIDFVVNNQTVTLKQYESKQIDNVTISIKKFRELGGDCRDFNRNT